jgi:hypothetical protein
MEKMVTKMSPTYKINGNVVCIASGKKELRGF